MTKDIIETVNS